MNCPKCGEFVGECGLTASSERKCFECGHAFNEARFSMAEP